MRPAQATPPAWVAHACLLMLCAPYLQGGLQKLADFPGALAEMRHFGLLPATGFALAVIGLELGASALVLTGRLRWLGSAALAVFTLLATLLANRFWHLAGPERFAATNAFFEHVGLAGALLLVAWLDVRRRNGAARESV